MDGAAAITLNSRCWGVAVVLWSRDGTAAEHGAASAHGRDGCCGNAADTDAAGRGTLPRIEVVREASCGQADAQPQRRELALRPNGPVSFVRCRGS